LQTSFQIFTRLHEVLDVVNDRKIDSKKFKELCLICRKIDICQDLEKVPKVITGME
jgi:hypothetical protein